MGVFTDLFVIVIMSPVVVWRRMFLFARGGRTALSEGIRAVEEKVELAAESGA